MSAGQLKSAPLKGASVVRRRATIGIPGKSSRKYAIKLSGYSHGAPYPTTTTPIPGADTSTFRALEEPRMEFTGQPCRLRIASRSNRRLGENSTCSTVFNAILDSSDLYSLDTAPLFQTSILAHQPQHLFGVLANSPAMARPVDEEFLESSHLHAATLAELDPGNCFPLNPECTSLLSNAERRPPNRR